MSRVSYVRVLGAIGMVGSQVGMEIVIALEDKILDGPEIGRIVQRALQGLKMAGVTQEDLDKIQFITDPYDFQSLEFRDGDMLIYSPLEVNAKLKINLE